MYTVYSLLISVYSVSLTHESNIPGTGPLGHWGTGALAPDQTISRALRPNGSLDHQDSRRGPQVNISNLPLTDVRCFKLGVFQGLTPKPLGQPMKSPLKSLNVRIWGSRCSHISRTPWQASFAVGNSGAGDVVLQQGGIFVCQLYTVVKEGLVSLSDSLMGMESG